MALLDREIEGQIDQVQRLILDLQGLKYIDREGLELLKRWSGEKLILRDCSAFMRTLLATHGL